MSKEFNLEKEYEMLRKKYKQLPSFKELDSEFELSMNPLKEIYEIRYPLRWIRRRMIDKIGWVATFLQNVLAPNPAFLVNIQESKFLESEKDRIMALLKDLMHLARRSMFFDLNSNDKAEAEFIASVHKEWHGNKGKIVGLVNKVDKGWKEETNEEITDRYIG